PVDGLRRPTAWVVNRAVNQTCPSEATVMLRGATVVEPSMVGVVVTAPVAASIRPRLLVPGALTSPGWVNQALPATSTATSAGSTTGDEVNCPFAGGGRQPSSLLKAVIHTSVAPTARLPPSALVLGIGTGVWKLWVATSKRIRVGSLEVR